MVALGLDAMTHVRPLLVLEAPTVSACMALLLIHDLQSDAAPANPNGGYPLT